MWPLQGVSRSSVWNPWSAMGSIQNFLIHPVQGSKYNLIFQRIPHSPVVSVGAVVRRVELVVVWLWFQRQFVFVK